MVVDESVDDLEGEFEVRCEPVAASTARAAGNRIGSLPARQQDMIFPRAHDSRTAKALASYLTTASFVDWGMEVLGLDVHI
ncbi:hypothetical protein D3C78_1857200 [compost metagenome]